MTRANMRPNPASKHMHLYQTFHGGVNSVDADEKIRDQELSDLQNIDIGERGSLRRRTGFTERIASPTSGLDAQGYFRYFKEGTGYEEIVAMDGYLYKDGDIQGIEDLPRFQTTRQIEAVQFLDKLYIATGTTLVQYDGTDFKPVEPHKPKPLEALYVGTNGLADDPTNFMQDGEANNLRVDGVTFSSRYGVINEPVTLTAYISKPNDDPDTEYKFEMRTTEQVEGFWETGQDWSSEKTFELMPTIEGDYQFRILARPVGGDEFSEKTHLIPKYKVRPAADPNDEDVPTETIHSCNRILLHWDRLVLYGDETQPDAIFISHLNNPGYFPIPNSLRFENERRERLVSLVKFRDHLVGFTPATIQAVFGKSPGDYQRIMLSSAVGCVADQSVVVMENYLTFLAKEGVHVLKSTGYNETRANVEKIDINVANLIPRTSNACAVVTDNQYHLVFPDEGLRFRYYIQKRVWTKDLSERLDFTQMKEWDGVLYGLRKTGQVLAHDKNVFADDDYIYEDVIETKYYDFGEPYHDKKMREISFMMGSDNEKTSFSMFVYVDNALMVSTDTSYASTDEDGNVTWVEQSEANFHIESGTTLGTWEMGASPFGEISSDVYKLRVSGRGRLIKVRMKHTDNTNIVLLGLGLQFKTKAP